VWLSLRLGSSWLLVETPIQFQFGVLSDVWECLVVGECIQVFADLDTVVVLGRDQGNMSLAEHTMQQCSDSMILSSVGYFTVNQLSLMQRSGPWPTKWGSLPHISYKTHCCQAQYNIITRYTGIVYQVV